MKYAAIAALLSTASAAATASGASCTTAIECATGNSCSSVEKGTGNTEASPLLKICIPDANCVSLAEVTGSDTKAYKPTVSTCMGLLTTDTTVVSMWEYYKVFNGAPV